MCKAERPKANHARRRGQKPGWLSRDRPDLHTILSVFDRGHFVRNGARMTTTTAKTKKMETTINTVKQEKQENQEKKERTSRTCGRKAERSGNLAPLPRSHIINDPRDFVVREACREKCRGGTCSGTLSPPCPFDESPFDWDLFEKEKCLFQPYRRLVISFSSHPHVATGDEPDDTV